MSDIFTIVIQSLWFIAPAYVANGFPPLMNGKRPLDGKMMFKGKRLFGDGKTWEGTIGGIIAGICVGWLQLVSQKNLEYLGLNLPEITMPLVIMLCIGTMAGDILGSFIKRRLNIERGGPAPLLDQDGFVLMAIIFSLAVYKADIIIYIVLLLITPPIHFITNVIGYYLKFKKTPW